MTAKKFFESALRYTGNDCLLWPFAKSRSGYAKVTVGHQRWREGHRIICERIHGAPPTPKHIAAHSCGKKPCLTQNHIRWATQSENLFDRWHHGTHIHGEIAYNSKLTDDAVHDIRNTKGPLKEMANKYGVHFSTISSIRLGKHWKHL